MPVVPATSATRRRTSVWPWIVGFGSLLAALLIAIGARVDDTDSPSIVGQVAPGFAATLVQAGPVAMRRGPQDSRGRPLLLHFWAPSCGPCVAELPRWQALADRGRSAGFDVLTVSGDDEADVRAFLAQRRLTLPVVLDVTGRIHGAYGVAGIPHTVAIDRHGIVMRELPGARPQAQYEAALQELRDR